MAKLYPACPHQPAWGVPCGLGCHNAYTSPYYAQLVTYTKHTGGFIPVANYSTNSTSMPQKSDEEVVVAELDHHDESCVGCMIEPASVSVVFPKTGFQMELCQRCASVMGSKVVFVVADL
jgi:hypothetical protein